MVTVSSIFNITMLLLHGSCTASIPQVRCPSQKWKDKQSHCINTKVYALYMLFTSMHLLLLKTISCIPLKVVIIYNCLNFDDVNQSSVMSCLMLKESVHFNIIKNFQILKILYNSRCYHITKIIYCFVCGFIVYI